MKHIIKILLALLLAVGVFAGCAVPEDSGTKAKDKSGKASNTSEPFETQESYEPDAGEPIPEPEPAPEPDPAVKYSHSCDYLLGDFTSYTPGGFRFVADAKLRNTGNVGVVARVHAIWFQAGGGKVEMTRFGVQIPYNGSKRVGFTKQVGSDEIDLIQAMNYDDQCKVEVVMVDTFGEAHDG